MIDVQEVIKDVPHFDTFCSVKKLHELVDSLRTDARFEIKVPGTSVGGHPIHHVRFGAGTVKVLVVAFPHCIEPIGGLTVFSLMTLLHQSNRALCDADVEWHIVPCIDPDGALLNEGWSQQAFTLENYMRHYYLQAFQDQVDFSFPVNYKKLIWNQPSQEAKVLKRLIDQLRPDFYFSLHNTRMGGAGYFISRDIGQKYYQQIYQLLEQQGLPIQKAPLWKEVCTPFSEGILEMSTMKKYYDYMEQTTPSPEALMRHGVESWTYLLDIKPSALTFVAELGYARHPSDGSQKETEQNLRKFKLRIDADSKYLAALVLEEWEKVKEVVDTASPLYRAMVSYALPTKEKICQGGWPLARYPTRDILFEPQYDRMMTDGDRFNACLVDGGLWSLFPLWSYQFVRLLKGSPQTPLVRQAIARLEQAFDEALADVAGYVDFNAFEIFDCDTLAKVQLGSGLIVLNSLLARDDSETRQQAL